MCGREGRGEDFDEGEIGEGEGEGDLMEAGGEGGYRGGSGVSVVWHIEENRVVELP